MVRHHALCVHPVFGQIEMCQRFGDDTCDPRIGKKASPCASVQLRLDLFAEQLFEPSFVRRRKQSPVCLLRGDDDTLPVELEFLKDGSRQGVGKTKDAEVEGLVGFPMWEPAARSDRGHAGEFNSKEPTRCRRHDGRRRYEGQFKRAGGMPALRKTSNELLLAFCGAATRRCKITGLLFPPRLWLR